MASRPLLILAIDDNPDNLTTLRAVLTDALPEAALLTATNGPRGIELARSADPDVVLLDIVMPGMDGYEVCRRLKSEPGLQLIPVLFLTALRTSREIRYQALRAGAEGFLSKPLDDIELTAQILTMVQIKQGNLMREGQKEQLRGLVEERTQALQAEIEDRKLAEQALRESEERYRSIFDQSPIGITLTDSLTGEIYQANPKYEEIVGRPIKPAGQPITWMSLTHPDDIAPDQANMERLNRGEIKSFQMVKRFLRPDGTSVWVNLSITPSNVKTYGSRCHLCLVEDISERKRREEEIVYLGSHDVLTGLYNRTFFDEEVKRLDVERQLPLSVIIGDIDGLKLINDAFGHCDGDRLLVVAADILRSCCRQEDIMARIGGDEFAVLLPKTGQEAAFTVLKRIQEAARTPTRLPGGLRLFSISLGFGTKERTDQPISQVMKEAEDHMYRRKLLEQRSLHHNLLSSITATMHEKSHETKAHGERLARLSQQIGRRLGLSDAKLQDLVLLSNLHDIGKIIIDDHILTKPDKLNDQEWAEMKKHPEVGCRIAQASPDIQHIAEAILCHHERWDGRGYPEGRIGEEIPVISRILAVVDAFDAMTHDRVYRKALPPDAVRQEIEANAGRQFDPRIAGIFIDLLDRYGPAIIDLEQE
jgi:diguanylate cyclase (GGDEF)-like protein/PAS domain S-box-containing protein